MKTGSEFHVGIVGLGSIGTGTALSYVRAGLSTWGTDLNSNACTTLKEAGACGVSDNTAAFVEGPDTLLVLVANAAQVKQVLFSETGIAQHLKPDTVVMVSSTITSADTQETATALAEFDLEMLNAPVSGGAVKAANDEITVTASGSGIAFERPTPVLEAVTGKVYHTDAEPGLDSTVKIIHQLLTGVHVIAGAEAMALAARTRIPLDVMYDVVTSAAGNSWMFGDRMHRVVDDDCTPHSAVDTFVRNFGLAADTAKALHFPLPLAPTALNISTNANNAGYGKEDDSTAIKIFSDITLPRARS